MAKVFITITDNEEEVDVDLITGEDLDPKHPTLALLATGLGNIPVLLQWRKWKE